MKTTFKAALIASTVALGLGVSACAESETAEDTTAEDTMAAADEVFGSCEAAFSSALSHVRDYRPARIGLADLYWLRFLQAEAGNDLRWMRRCQELIERYAPGRYERRLTYSTRFA